jgi:predicted amidohydrolase YtcJ
MRHAILAAMVGVAAVGAQTPPPPDTILVNGHVVTVDQAFSIAQAIAIRDGRFTAVGTDAAIRKLAGPSTTIIDLKQRTVIPGLADGHLHDAGGGPGVDLSRARSISDLLATVRSRVTQSRPGDVIISNSDWHEAQLKEHRLPTGGIWIRFLRKTRSSSCEVVTNIS